MTFFQSIASHCLILFLVKPQYFQYSLASMVYFLNFLLSFKMRLYMIINDFRYCNLNENQLILICCIPNINSLFFFIVQTSSN